MSLWIELHLAYNNAASESPVEAHVLHEVWDYIRWCTDEYRNDDMEQAICLAFFEHLLDTRAISEDLPLRITVKEAERCVPCAT